LSFAASYSAVSPFAVLTVAVLVCLCTHMAPPFPADREQGEEGRASAEVEKTV
jgi:hypothetical protein